MDKVWLEIKIVDANQLVKKEDKVVRAVVGTAIQQDTQEQAHTLLEIEQITEDGEGNLTLAEGHKQLLSAELINLYYFINCIRFINSIQRRAH